MGRIIMTIATQRFGFSQKIIGLALLAAFGSAHAEDDEVAQLIKPESSVSAGLGIASGAGKDRTIFGQYNGLRTNDAHLLLDFEILKRDDATGLWTNIEGRNLGLDNRELRFSQQKQGDWKYSAEYDQLTRHDLRTINTGLLNAGTATPTVVSLAAPGTGADLNLNTKRKSMALGAEKWLTPNLQFEASFKTEDKDGARLFGRGLTCAAFPNSFNLCGITSTPTGAMLLLPEPINSTTRQFDAKLNYSGEQFMLSGGYYGSFFTNANSALSPLVSGNLWNPNGTLLNTGTAPGNTLAGFLQQPMALPPENQAHQLYVSGNYAFTPTTRATFKYAYSHATQNQSFPAVFISSPTANLGGTVNTTLAQLGLTARPLAKLSLLANLRYEDKDDTTPLALYNLTGLATNPANFFTNNQNSSTKLTGKLEASYRLPENTRATLGIDYASVQRSRPVSSTVISGLTALREDTREQGYRAELGRAFSETLHASLSYVSSRREGSNWLKPNTLPQTGVTELSDLAIYNPTGAFPMTLEDRQRDKLKLSADWSPMELLSLQLMFENGKDAYSAPTTKGLRDTGVRSYGIDAAYLLSDKWKLTGYWNRGSQTLHVDHATGYLAELENISSSLGLGAVGKLSSKLELGGDLSYMNDRNRYRQSLSSGDELAGEGLPDVSYRLTRLKFFGKYALEKNADLRVDLVHQRAKLDEWTWAYNGTSFVYSDNTTISLQPNQNVTFLGATYIYKLK